LRDLPDNGYYVNAISWAFSKKNCQETNKEATDELKRLFLAFNLPWDKDMATCILVIIYLALSPPKLVQTQFKSLGDATFSSLWATLQDALQA
jgi:hypothetical protein